MNDSFNIQDRRAAAMKPRPSSVGNVRESVPKERNSMAEIVVTRGLPGSGKSTWARAWVDADPANRVRVSRDDIRFMLYGKYTGVDEQTVTRVEEALVRDALAQGQEVVVDAMHLAARYLKRWARLGQVRLQDFPVPLADCIRRDAGRERNLGADVIRGIAKRYGIKDDGQLPSPAAQGHRNAPDHEDNDE